MSDEILPPSDKVRLVVADVATGDFFRLTAGGITDKLIFRRCQDRSNAHELEVPLSVFNGGLNKELRLRPAGSSAEVEIYVIIDEAAHNGGVEIALLRAQLADLQKRHDDGIAALGKELDEARGQNPQGEAKGGLTEEEIGYLRERDGMIELLTPYIEDPESDTPVGVLSKVLRDFEALKLPPAAAAAQAGDRTPEFPNGVTSTPAPGGGEGTSKPAPEGTGHAPVDASKAGANGEPPGPPITAETRVEKKPEPVEFNQQEFLDSLPRDIAKLRGMAAPAGIEGAHSMNQNQLRKALLKYEIERHAVKPVAPTNTARPDGEQPAA